MSLKLTLLNKGARDARGISAQVQSPNPQVLILQGTLTLPALPAGTADETTEELQFLVQDPAREILQLQVRIDADGRAALIPLEIPVFADVQAPANLIINDGAKVTMWEHATSKTRKALGAGNGDRRANPGETISLLLPDGSAFRAGEMFTFDPCVDQSSSNTSAGQYLPWRLSDDWGDYDNVGGSVKYSLPIISSSCPPGHRITFFVRYQIPNKPEHLLKQGVVTVAITGSDRTPPQPAGARVSGHVVEIDLREGSGVRSATAVFRTQSITLRVPLNDEGRDGDLTAGDAIFSGMIVNPPAGTYTLTVSAQDALGNSGTVPVRGTFRFP